MFSVRLSVLRSVFDVHTKPAVEMIASLPAAGLCTGVAAKNYYEALGISKQSTQSDIKAAYYKLSMQFHPDKNQGSASAAKKFREITQAYEVLGNYKLRRLYDKGIIHPAAQQHAQASTMSENYAEEVHDSPEVKFYKSRSKRSKVPDPSGKTPIYNFDEWSRSHYGKTFQRRQDAKEKFNNREAKDRLHILSTQNEIVLYGMFALIVCMYIAFIAETSSHDQPRKSVLKTAESKEE